MILKRPDVRLPALITAVLTFFVYLLTLEPDLTWTNFGGDGGELITAATTLGIPHPPGYPTYVLIGNLFGRIPIGTVAFRFNLLSAVGTAVSAGFLAGVVFRIRPVINNRASKRRSVNGAGDLRGMIVAVAAGLSFGFGSLVWGQATIAEVYPLNLAFISALLFTLTKPSVGATLVVAQYSDNNHAHPPPDPLINQTDQGDHKGRPYLSGLLLGLAITTHLTSIILLPLVLILTPRKHWSRLFISLLIGLSPFLTLPLLAQSGSPVIWGQPESFDSWGWLVSAQLYRPNVFGLPLTDWPARFSEWGLPFLAQFGYVGLPLIVVGMIGRFKSHRRLITALTATASLYLLYAFSYNTIDAAVLLLPAVLVLSILLGFGLHSLGKAALILPLTLLWLNLGSLGNGYYVNMTVVDGSAVRPAAEALLDDLPVGAIVETAGDPTIAALWYFHHVEEIRPDIIIIDGNLFQFEWYRAQLGRDYPILKHLVEDDLAGFRAENGQLRPYCQASLVQPGYLRCED